AQAYVAMGSLDGRSGEGLECHKARTGGGTESGLKISPHTFLPSPPSLLAPPARRMPASALCLRRLSPEEGSWRDGLTAHTPPSLPGTQHREHGEIERSLREFERIKTL
ncbi:MAG: hypothetical protein ACK559_18955, partial [bacterium]